MQRTRIEAGDRRGLSNKSEPLRPSGQGPLVYLPPHSETSEEQYAAFKRLVLAGLREHIMAQDMCSTLTCGTPGSVQTRQEDFNQQAAN